MVRLLVTPRGVGKSELLDNYIEECKKRGIEFRVISWEEYQKEMIKGVENDATIKSKSSSGGRGIHG